MMQSLLRIITLVLAVSISLASAWISPHQQAQLSSFQNQKKQRSFLFSTEKETLVDATTDTTDNYDYMVPDDAVIHIQPNAMRRLRELRDQRQSSSSPLLLRMGVRSGGCSGMSYVMDFGSPESIQEDDQVDTYETENIQCVVDSKSMLYLYGLKLDYSDALIGGGFKFFNPNADEACGCGSSFGV